MILGTQINPTTADSYSESGPSIAALNDGGFVVTWDYGNSSDSEIYAQRYNSNGEAQGSEFVVNTYTIGNQLDPSITDLKDGGFVVSWESVGQDSSSFFDIYAQRYDANGVAQGKEFLVNSYTTDNQFRSSIASLNDGGFVVSWTSAGQDGSDWGVYAQRYDASGIAQDSEFRVNTTTTNYQSTSSVTGLNDGGFVVSWSSGDNSLADINAQRYDADGVAVGSEFQSNTAIGEQFPSSIIALNDGGFVATWKNP